MEVKKTEKQHAPARDERGRLLPGHSGNPEGRPPGVKHHLSRAFLQDLAKTWQEQGGDILERVAKDEPATLLRVIASLVPKEMLLKLEGSAVTEGRIITLVPRELLAERETGITIDQEPDEGEEDWL